MLEPPASLSLEDAVDYVIQGCEAIAEAHSYSIVHRDIKPANLFLSKRPNGSAIVKVLDFGISKRTDGGEVDNLTRTTTALGSALYMSPEQMQASRGVDHRTDIYALGISLYELLAGRQPFYADTLPQLCAEIFTGTPTPIRTLRPDIPEALSQVLERAYARDRAYRYQSVSELVVALAPFAPARSQTLIDSIAKLGGLNPPIPTGSGPHTVRMPGSFPSGVYPQATASLPPGTSPLSPITGGSTGRPVVSTGAQAAVPPPPRRNTWAAPVLVLSALGLMGGGVWAVVRRPHLPLPADTASASAEASIAATTAATASPSVAAPVTSATAPIASVAPPTAPSSTVAPPTADVAAASASGAADAAATTPTRPERGARGRGQPPRGPRPSAGAPAGAWGGAEPPRAVYVPPATTPAPSNTLGF